MTQLIQLLDKVEVFSKKVKNLYRINASMQSMLVKYAELFETLSTTVPLPVSRVTMNLRPECKVTTIGTYTSQRCMSSCENPIT